MNNFTISVQAVAPMFFMMLVGSIVRRVKLLDDLELSHVNNMIFRVLLPVLMFSNIYDSQISEIVNMKLIIFGIASIFIIYFAAVLFTMNIEKSNASRGAMIQAIYRSNVIIMGLPIVANTYGDTNLGMTAVMISIIVPLYNILAVITLETFRGGKIHFTKVLAGILNNPLIIGSAAGVLLLLLDIRLPLIIEKTVSSISGAATPMALIVLGASFRLSSVSECTRNLIICVVGRLIVVPGIFLTAAALFGFRDIAFLTLVGIFSAPCAISSFTMAQQMDSDCELAASSVLFTSALSCFTIFFWIFLFKYLGMF